MSYNDILDALVNTAPELDANELRMLLELLTEDGDATSYLHGLVASGRLTEAQADRISAIR